MSCDLDKFKESVFEELKTLRMLETQVKGTIFEENPPPKGLLAGVVKSFINRFGPRAAKDVLNQPYYSVPRQTAEDLLTDPDFKDILCKPFRITFYSELTDMRLVQIVIDTLYHSGVRAPDGKDLNVRDYAFICYELSKHGHESFCRDKASNNDA